MLESPWSELIDLPPSAMKPAGGNKRELPKPEELQVSGVGPPCSYMQAAQIRSRLLVQRAEASATAHLLNGGLSSAY